MPTRDAGCPDGSNPIPTGPGSLADIDPGRALLVATCSRSKAYGGQPSATANHMKQWPQELAAARVRVLASAETDLSTVMPAWRRYTGLFYRHARPALESAAAAGRLVIISGGYGVVRADELIGWYDKRLCLADWPPGLLETVLINEARRIDAPTAVVFAPAATQYADLVRVTPWGNAGMTAYLVTVTDPRGSVTLATLRGMGQAFGAFWNGSHDAYPPTVAVEKLR